MYVYTDPNVKIDLSINLDVDKIYVLSMDVAESPLDKGVPHYLLAGYKDGSDQPQFELITDSRANYERIASLQLDWAGSLNKAPAEWIIPVGQEFLKITRLNNVTAEWHKEHGTAVPTYIVYGDSDYPTWQAAASAVLNVYAPYFKAPLEKLVATEFHAGISIFRKLFATDINYNYVKATIRVFNLDPVRALSLRIPRIMELTAQDWIFRDSNRYRLEGMERGAQLNAVINTVLPPGLVAYLDVCTFGQINDDFNRAYRLNNSFTFVKQAAHQLNKVFGSPSVDARALDNLSFTPFNLFGAKIKPSRGGIHGGISNYYCPKDKAVVSFDVKSMYPALMRHFNLISRKLTDGWKFFEALDLRLSGKEPEIKLALNSFYGLHNNRYSCIYDPVQAVRICLTGQLLMIMVLELVFDELHQTGELDQVKLVQINTDGFMLEVPADVIERDPVKIVSRAGVEMPEVKAVLSGCTSMERAEGIAYQGFLAYQRESGADAQFSAYLASAASAGNYSPVGTALELGDYFERCALGREYGSKLMRGVKGLVWRIPYLLREIAGAQTTVQFFDGMYQRHINEYLAWERKRMGPYMEILSVCKGKGAMFNGDDSLKTIPRVIRDAVRNSIVYGISPAETISSCADFSRFMVQFNKKHKDDVLHHKFMGDLDIGINGFICAYAPAASLSYELKKANNTGPVVLLPSGGQETARPLSVPGCASDNFAIPPRTASGRKLNVLEHVNYGWYIQAAEKYLEGVKNAKAAAEYKAVIGGLAFIK